MSRTGSLILFSTNAAQFKASGEMAHLRQWLREVRRDMSGSACRQVAHYARELIRLFGAETAHLVEGPPGHLRERLDAVDLPRHGYARHAHRHLLRAGRALHAAAHDLDIERARKLMDRRTPQRSTPAGQHVDRSPLPSGDLLDGLPTDLVGSAAPTESDEVDDGPSARPAEDLPADVRPVVEAIDALVAARRDLDDVSDVPAATKAVVSTLDADTRVEVALQLPGAAQLPVALRQEKASMCLADLASEVLAGLMEQRYADQRPV